jgi:hypothetical protein
MTDTKICPLTQSEEAKHFTRCIEERCAWWDQAANDCAVKEISVKLRGIETCVSRR